MADDYLLSMKTVLMIAPYFVPRRRVGSLRPYKFASHLTAFGWKPVVYTIGTPNEELTPREKKALHGVTIKEINPPFDRTTDKKQSELHKDVEISHRIWTKWSERLAQWFDRQVPMDTWFFLFRSAYSEILKQAETLNPDIIWSTGDPWSGHWLGHKLSGDLKKPWIADFRDPWTLSGLNLRKRSFFSNRADRKLEKKFVSAADKLIFTSKATEELYRNFYSLNPGKADTIYNSFELQNKEAAVSTEQTWKANIDDSKLNLVFFGSFRRLSPIDPIADAVAELRDDIQPHLRIHSFGSLEAEDKKKLESLGITDLFVTHEKVVPELAPAVFEKADLLLVSTSGERESIIPAKLWEYMISDKPILSITPNSEIGEILKKTGVGVHFHNSETSEIAGMLGRAIERKQSGEPVLDFERKQEVIETYSAKNNTRKLAQIMNTFAGYGQ